MRIKLILLFTFSFLTGFSQMSEKNLVQFSGLITNVDSNTIVPYVTVTNISSRRQVFSANYKGYFSFVAHESDTITFTAVGFKKEAIIIPRNLPENRYTIMMKMKQEIVNLPVVRVYPWASMDEFKREFMAIKFADDDLEIAKKNISKDKLIAMAAVLPRDGQEMQGFNFQNNHYNLTNKNINQRFANPLLNPFAWASFMQQIIQGDKSRDKN
jgi:hypothetical protein